MHFTKNFLAVVAITSLSSAAPIANPESSLSPAARNPAPVSDSPYANYASAAIAAVEQRGAAPGPKPQPAPAGYGKYGKYGKYGQYGHYASYHKYPSEPPKPALKPASYAPYASYGHYKRAILNLFGF